MQSLKEIIQQMLESGYYPLTPEQTEALKKRLFS